VVNDARDLSRQQICESTSSKLRQATPGLNQLNATIGLDGFVDEIIAVVDRRTDHAHYEPIRTISELGEKIRAASGQSCNYELVVKRMKLGGNGPIMANALAELGVAITYIGNLGQPQVHPVFEPLAAKAKAIYSIGQPAHTDALEFEDGKLMLGKLTPLDDANWDNLIARIGREKLTEILSGASLVAMVNWTMLPHMTRVWAGLLDEVVPNIEQHRRKLFIDLCDPEKRTAADIVEALQLLGRFQEQIDVVLGLNLKEAQEVAEVLGLDGRADPEEQIEALAGAIRRELRLACVVVHPRRGAAAATEDESAIFAGPFVQHPVISTGAGDHFNAGFCLGQVLGFSLSECLCIGCATSGYYVRSGRSPQSTELANFIEKLPPPQG
jgi:sugar/nucleoside kinase (ribokinase family)